MSKKKIVLNAAAWALYAVSPMVLAQTYLPPVSVPQPGPVPVEKTYCNDRFIVAPRLNGENEYSGSTFSACNQGDSQAKLVAARFAYANGKLHGYLEGFSYAMFKSANANKNDAQAQAEGAATIDAHGSSMQAGLNEGIRVGQQKGSQFGGSEARKTWDNAFQSGNIPTANSNVGSIPVYSPSTNDPFQTFGPGRLSVQQIMQQDEILAPIRERAIEITGGSFITLDQPRVYSIWDLWFDNGRYDVERYKNGAWVNAQESLAFYKKHLKDLGVSDPYINLSSSHIGRVGPDGQNEIVNLKNIYDQGFLNSYKYYMNYYWQYSFHEALKDGALTGELVGQQVGKRIAFRDGLANAYNTKFFSEASKTYESAYINAYTNTYNDIFNNYSNSAKLNIVKVEKFDENNNGIIEPGEKVKFRIHLENRGGQSATSLKVQSSGDISRNETERLETLAALDKDVFETGYIAQINANHPAGRRASLLLTVTSDKGGSAQIDASSAIQNQIEAQGNAGVASVTTIDGKAVVSLPVRNVSTTNSPILTAQVKVAGNVVGTENLGSFNAGRSANVEVRVSGLDPLAIIKGSINAEIAILANGQPIDGAVGRVKIVSRNKGSDIVKVYTKAATNGRFEVPVSLGDARRLILAMNDKETQNNRKGQNVYKKNSSSTIPGKLANAKLEFTGDESAEQELHQLAVNMWGVRKNLPGFLSGKRKAYRKLLDKLTTNGSVKKAAKGRR